MTELRELEELWRTIAALLSDDPLSWPFTHLSPTVEDAQRAVLELARFTMNHKTAGAPLGYEPYVVINNLRNKYRAAEGVAFLNRQQDRARLGRGTPEMLDRNEQIELWNQELATYSSGKRRPRKERVEEIYRRCQKKYRDLKAEAHSLKRPMPRLSKAWTIGKDRIEKLLPPDRKSS